MRTIEYTHHWVPTESDAIENVYFNENTNTGFIDFKHSYVYQKTRACLEDFRALGTAESAGTYYNQNKYNAFGALYYLDSRVYLDFKQVAPDTLSDSGTPKGLTVTDATTVTTSSGISVGTITTGTTNTSTYIVPVTVPADWKGHWSVGFALDGSNDEKEFNAFDSSTADEAVQELLDVSARVGIKVETIKWVRFDFDK